MTMPVPAHGLELGGVSCVPSRVAENAINTCVSLSPPQEASKATANIADSHFTIIDLALRDFMECAPDQVDTKLPPEMPDLPWNDGSTHLTLHIRPPGVFITVVVGCHIPAIVKCSLRA